MDPEERGGPGERGLHLEDNVELLRALGQRLRGARTERGLSLGAVARSSGGEFKASAVANYERGDRTISVSRLVRLAELYHTSVGTLLGEVNPIMDLTNGYEAGGSGPGQPLVIDVGALQRTELGPELEMVRTFVNSLRAQRRDQGVRCTLRASDVVQLARAIGRTADAISEELGPAVIPP